MDYKKLILMTSPHIRIAELKRKIEKEFVDLFPAETPFVVAKIEDEYGYSLSNGSVVGDFLKHGDRIVAQPEGFVDQMGGGSTPGGAPMPGRGLYGGGNTSDLLAMIQNLQQSVVAKLASSVSGDNVAESSALSEQVLQTVMPLGLTDNRHVVHNLCLILGKTLTPDSAQLYNEP